MSLQITQTKTFIEVKLILETSHLTTEIAYIDPNAIIGIMPMGFASMCQVELFAKTITVQESAGDLYKRITQGLTPAVSATVVDEVV